MMFKTMKESTKKKKKNWREIADDFFMHEHFTFWHAQMIANSFFLPRENGVGHNPQEKRVFRNQILSSP